MARAMSPVVGRTCSVVVGSSAPDASSSAVTPLAKPTPAPSPRAAATTPTSVASSSTERSTCERLAPTARSRASSRVRCATRIEKVLEITKTPTSRAIAAEDGEDDLKELEPGLHVGGELRAGLPCR